MGLRRMALLGLSAALIALLGAELYFRAAGAIDQPLYERNDDYGYIPRANQKGAHLNRYDWAFNELHMGVEIPFRATPDGVLLLGDSLLAGERLTTQAQRVGPQVQALTGCPIWPVSAVSWGISNQIAYAMATPQVRDLGTIVFVLNSNDFGPKSKPHRSHRYRKPISALRIWLRHWRAGRYKSDHRPNRVDIYAAGRPIPDDGGIWRERLAQLRASYGGRIVMVQYPSRSQLSEGREVFPDMAGLDGIEVVKMRDDPRWGDGNYRDWMHPNITGNGALAAIIADQLKPCPSPGDEVN